MIITKVHLFIPALKQKQKMKKLITIAALLISAISFGQVPKKVIVEHFTNTWCSICASRNPGFYTNLNSQPGILHLAFHPSSPYSGCLLNQHNKPENDGRTKFYGVYGGTPRLVIQGTPIAAAANYNSATLFTPYTGQTTPIEITIKQNKTSTSNMLQQVVLKVVSPHTYTTARLYVAIAEDTLFYTGPNGEPKHFDVFREALTDSSGSIVNIPFNVGDSLVLNYSSPINAVWTSSKLLSVAILQDSNTLEVIQAEKTTAAQNDITLNLMPTEAEPSVFIFPNPFEEVIYIQNSFSKAFSSYQITDVSGKVVLRSSVLGKTIDVKSLGSGIYFLNLLGAEQEKTFKLVKQ